MKLRVSLGKREACELLEAVATLKKIRVDFKLNSVLLGNSNLIILFAVCDPVFCG
jgi:hypothetical protein